MANKLHPKILEKQALDISCLAARLSDQSAQENRGHKAGKQLRLQG